MWVCGSVIGVVCRVDHGAVVQKRSCGEGVLRYVGPPVGGVWRCAVATTRTESRPAEPYCRPSGTPPGCRYTEEVTRTETVRAIRYCSPRGAGSDCRYTERVTTTYTETAIEYCSPAGTPPLCAYTAQVSRTETRPAVRSCSPAGTLPFCRYTATETKPATLVYIGGTPVGYACPSRWKLSGSECSRRVTRYGSVAYRCPTDWSRTGPTCWRTVTVDVPATGTLKYRCKASWSRSGSTCSRSITETVTRYGTLRYRCRPGPWNRSGASCSRTFPVTVTRTGTLDYRCMRGWSRNVFECERSVPHTRYDEPTLTPTCTTGTPTGGRCYTHELPTKICDNSDVAESERWELVGGSCVRTLTHTPTCPAGFPDLRGGHCRPTPPTTTPTTTTAPPTPPTTAVPPSTPTTRAARPPGAPEFLQLEPGDRQFTASWQPPADDGGSPVTKYTVRYKMGLLGIRQDVTTAVDALDRQPDGTLSRVITGLTNNASYVVWVGAANPAGTTWTAARPVTLPEVPPVRISGLDGAVRIGKGTLAGDFTVTPADATCTARITNPPPDGPPPTGAAAPTVTLTPDTGASRTVTVTANTPGPVTVQITCTHQGHNAAIKSAVFDFASPDGCDLPHTWATKATIHQGEWSTSCTSEKRSNTQTPYYAKRYTFTLPTATTVAVDLKSSENTYLYLWGTGDDGTKVDLHNDNIDTTNRDSRLSVRLQPGTYTIEATTAAPRTTGNFTLIIAPITTDTAYHATVGEPWAAALKSPATPSRHTVTPPDGLDLTLTHSVGTATVAATPTRAGFYNATFAYASQLGTADSTITINVTCPERHVRRTDRTCRAANSIPTDLVVPNDPPHGHKLYQVSQAALAGMVQAADEMNHKFQNKCAAIPERYRLTRNMIVALLVAVQYHEVRQDSDATEPEPASLMYLSRGDFYHTSSPGRQKNLHLYSLKTYSYGDKYDYPNAFWHPGVGLWQLDDANKYGSKLNHVQRAHATTAAANAAEIIHDNYCTRASESPSAPFTGAKIEDKIIAHLKWSLLDSAWWGCSKLEGLIRRPANCYPTLVDIVRGDDVFADTRNAQSDSSYNGRLYLNVDPDLTDEYGGGVTALTCEWTGVRDGQTFDCDKYDISRANGHVGLSNVSSGTDPHNSLKDDSQRSPLAYPFLSFTHTMTNSEGKKTDLKYIVFKSTDTGYTDTKNNSIDLIAAVPVGTNVRTDPSGNPTDGWWHTNAVDGSGVRIVGPR